jgi:hypothetical protein
MKKAEEFQSIIDLVYSPLIRPEMIFKFLIRQGNSLMEKPSRIKAQRHTQGFLRLIFCKTPIVICITQSLGSFEL